MRNFTFILSIVLSIYCYGQKTEIESLINKIAAQEVPKDFKFYYLLQESHQQQKIFGSIQLYDKTKLLRQDLGFPLELLTAKSDENVDWKDFNLNNPKYIDKDMARSTPRIMKQVYFTKYKIEQSEFDSLVKSKRPYTLYIRKKWFWGKKRVWNEVVKAWNKDEKHNIEQKIYFSFSKPIFSSDIKYAKVSVSIQKRCNRHGYIGIYKKENGIWKGLIKYNQVASTTSGNCGDIIVNYKN